MSEFGDALGKAAELSRESRDGAAQWLVANEIDRDDFTDAAATICAEVEDRIEDGHNPRRTLAGAISLAMQTGFLVGRARGFLK